MTSPTQTVVGKGNSNPLIAGGLLKILIIEQKSNHTQRQNSKRKMLRAFYYNTK
jgi:hypothetical protein